MTFWLKFDLLLFEQITFTFLLLTALIIIARYTVLSSAKSNRSNEQYFEDFFVKRILTKDPF